MSACHSCNGWGVVYQIKTLVPRTKEARAHELKRQRQAGWSPGEIKLVVCTNCGGYGSRPEA